MKEDFNKLENDMWLHLSPKPMNTKEQWEYEFDKLFVEQGNHRGGKVVYE